MGWQISRKIPIARILTHVLPELEISESRPTNVTIGIACCFITPDIKLIYFYYIVYYTNTIAYLQLVNFRHRLSGLVFRLSVRGTDIRPGEKPVSYTRSMGTKACILSLIQLISVK